MVIRTQRSEDLSLPTYAIQFVSCSLFTYYNVLTQQPILVLMGGIQLTQLSLLVGLSYRYGGGVIPDARASTAPVPAVRPERGGRATSGGVPSDVSSGAFPTTVV